VAFGKKKRTKEETQKNEETTPTPVEAALEAIRNYVDQQGKQIDKMNEVLVETNKKIGELEANMSLLEKAHNTMTQRVFEDEEKMNTLTLRLEGMAKAIAKMRETKP